MGLFSKKSSKPHLVLTIPEMSCNHCERTITTMLTAIDGVTDVQADAKSKQVIVETEKPVTFEAIEQTLKPTNYNPVLKADKQ